MHPLIPEMFQTIWIAYTPRSYFSPSGETLWGLFFEIFSPADTIQSLISEILSGSNITSACSTSHFSTAENSIQSLLSEILLSSGASIQSLLSEVFLSSGAYIQSLLSEIFLPSGTSIQSLLSEIHINISTYRHIDISTY